MEIFDGFEKSFCSKENEPFIGNRVEPAWKKKLQKNEKRAVRDKQQSDAWLFLCQKCQQTDKATAGEMTALTATAGEILAAPVEAAVPIL